MPVPLLDVRRQNAPLAGELCAAAARVIASGTYILGPEVERFEAAAAAVAGAEFAVGLSSGTDALLVALLALGIGPGDEVICPSFTFFATAGSIARTGARPVFADSLPDSFNLDAGAVEALITPRTRAIIPVHLFGQAADLDAIREIAARHGLRVIEDAAQSFGAEYGGRKVGALGDCGTVSFYPSKNLGGFGEAGLLVTNDSGIAARARLVRNHGAERQYFHSTVGGNFRLDALQAALLSVKLPHLDAYTAARQRHAARYAELLGGLEGCLILPPLLPGRSHIVNQYTIRVPGRRDALKAHLDGRGIGTAIYYPLPLHRQECFRDYGPYPALPVADRLAAESLSLPVFPEMTEAEQDEVAQAIREFFSGSGR
jgi:dTDP-4-amino-4,6-dideoxygalactose transaminase